jgi:flavocytochrome c
MLAAVEEAVVKAGGIPGKLKSAKPGITAREIKKAADVVIVGGGGSGLAAAIAAKQNGASVIIIEKSGYTGGNTMVAGGIYNAPDPELQRQVKSSSGVEALITSALAENPVNEDHARLQATVRAEFDAYKKSGATYLFDSPNWFALQTWNGGDKVGSLTMVKVLANNALDALRWVMSQGYEIRPNFIAQGGGALYQRTHYSVKPSGTGFIDAYMDSLSKTDVEILYSTTAKELIKEGNRVTGVKARDKAGNTYTITAKKGVILPTGGFAGNAAMVQQYNTSGKWPDLSRSNSSNLPAITGDGIIMAQAIGAAVKDMDQIQLLHLCDYKTGKLKANIWDGAANTIFINQEGKRFVAEDGRRDDISVAALKQTKGMFYVLVSAEGIPSPETTTDLALVPLKDLIASNDVFTGSTLQEVCSKVKLDPQAVRETINAYNTLIDQKAVTDQFNRRLFDKKLLTPPFYIVPRAPSVHHTMGGLVISENCQVLDTKGTVISGLFAAGEIVGGVHGANRLGGNAIAETVVFGHLAGNSASK